MEVDSQKMECAGRGEATAQLCVLNKFIQMQSRQINSIGTSINMEIDAARLKCYCISIHTVHSPSDIISSHPYDYLFVSINHCERKKKSFVCVCVC